MIEFSFQDSGKISVLVPSHGPPPFRVDAEINPEGKDLPLERPEDVEMWEPSGELWGFIKGKSVERICSVTITDFTDSTEPNPLTTGSVKFNISRDPVGAPIFYRDVPFIPTVNQRTESILPLEGMNMRYILWRLRDISRSESKVILKDMPTCANCHTFSKDGKWLGMDIDGTFGDKGADDTAFVHCSPTWSPDGQTIIFSRAKAKDPYTPDQKAPLHANDPEETQIQYDLYRIPFNGGLGGKAERIAGASENGMSNNFAKVTPDHKFIIWVQCRNGLLMRPDSKLWIVPMSGGTPRLMNCNTPLMNSWHSISPNGRWMVFSSKCFSP